MNRQEIIAKKNDPKAPKTTAQSQLVIEGRKVRINFPENADERVLSEIRRMALSGAAHV
jgi:hypothetical protein